MLSRGKRLIWCPAILTASALRHGATGSQTDSTNTLAQLGRDAPGAELDLAKPLVRAPTMNSTPSSFTAPRVTSTGASLKAPIVAALAALSGVKHGAMNHRIERPVEALSTRSRKWP